ncbi:MAG: methionyl-tRNA formyltransferase [Crocinitomicaceae bacterium]|nr:methionyl-tRNA formyltransferase [Crocinitomicaceae bacterium]
MSGKIIFMGTPDFAVESLKQILENGIEVAAVVTAPDRPAGRGQQLSASAVKEFAVSKGLTILQPEKLKDEDFLNELKTINADLFVVVAFRMLPEVVWNMPPKGTINLHGSLLPQYRGAAPINWAVINGEKKTGATTFFIEKEIDTGKVIDKVEIDISDTDTAGSVHDRLMVKGAELLAKTVKQILDGTVKAIPQNELIKGELKEAPKIFKPDCKIDWNHSTVEIYNKIRGLSPYPAAWTSIQKDDQVRSIKLFKTTKALDGSSHSNEIKIEKDHLYFGTADGWLQIDELQIEGKKRMNVSDFLKGFQIQDWKLIN